MKRALAAGLLTISLTALVCGCSRSPRVTYYTLEPAPRQNAVVTAPPSSAQPAQPANQVFDPAGVSIVVGPITLPELVDRPQLVVRESATTVNVLESQRWGEPLKSAIPRVVAEDLVALLGSARVSSHVQNVGSNADCRVLLDMLRFEAVPGEGVSVEAAWSLRCASGGPSRTGRSLLREPASGAGYDPLIAAYGRALLALSTDLARALRGETGAPQLQR